MTKKYSSGASALSDRHCNVTTPVSFPKDAPFGGLSRLTWHGSWPGVSNGIGVGVLVEVGVWVPVGVLVGVRVPVRAGVLVGVRVLVRVGVLVGVAVSVAAELDVRVAVLVAVGGRGVAVGECVTTGVAVAADVMVGLGACAVSVATTPYAIAVSVALRSGVVLSTFT